MKSSLLAKRLFLGYEPVDPTLSDARTARLLGRKFYAKKISGITLFRRRHLRKNNRILQSVHDFLQSIVYISCRSVGLYLLSFGLLTLLLNFSKYYSVEGADVFFPLLSGAVVSLFAIPLLLSGRPLCLVLQNIRLTDSLFFEFFCLRRMHPAEAVPSLPGAISAFCGAGVALFGFFVSMPHALLLPPALLFFFLALSAPEFPFFLTLILLPYLPMLKDPSITLTALVLCGLLSFFRKVARGNRVLSLEQYDSVLTLFALFVLIGGAAAGLPAFRAAWYVVLLLFGYTFAGNLISNRRLVDGVFHALIYASFPISLFAVFQIAAGKESYPLFGREISGLVDGHVTGTFETPDVFAVYLLAVIILTVSRALDRQRPVSLRVSCLFLALLQGTALCFTGERGACLALLFALAAYAVLKTVRRAPGVFLALLVLLPYGIFLLPSAARSWCLSFLLSGADRAATAQANIKAALMLFRDHPFLGAGIGEDALRGALSSYLPAGVAATDAGNLFLEIGCEAGGIALLFFLFLLIVRAHHLSFYARYLPSSSVGTHAVAVSVASVALLVYGMTENIFANPVTIYLFFVLFGIGSATFRLAKQDRDERLIYYGDDRSADASVADILISDKFL